MAFDFNNGNTPQENSNNYWSENEIETYTPSGFPDVPGFTPSGSDYPSVPESDPFNNAGWGNDYGPGPGPGPGPRPGPGPGPGPKPPIDWGPILKVVFYLAVVIGVFALIYVYRDLIQAFLGTVATWMIIFIVLIFILRLLLGIGRRRW